MTLNFIFQKLVKSFVVLAITHKKSRYLTEKHPHNKID
jgi:hypothetical protein